MKRNTFVVGLILLTYFVISFLTNIVGPLVPEIIEDFGLSLAMVAVLPFAFFAAYGVMSIPSGILVERYTAKRVMVSAFGIAFLGSALFALVPAYPVAIASLFLIGVGMCMLEVAIQPLLRVCGGEEHYAFNSALGQLFFGSASFLSPFVYSYLVLNLADPASDNLLVAWLSAIVPPDLPWISMYWICAAVALIMMAVVSLSRIPTVAASIDSAGVARDSLALLREPVVIAYFFGIFCYVGTEQGVATWTSEFLSTYHGYDPQTTGARSVSFFWGSMTIGTLFGLLAFKLFDTRRVLVGFGTAGLICLTIALAGSGPVAVYALPAVGFFISVLWSSIMSLALNSVTEHHGSVAGILVTGVIGGAVVPLVIGSIGDALGLRTGLLFLYLTMGYMVSIGIWARPLVTNRTVWDRPRPRDGGSK